MLSQDSEMLNYTGRMTGTLSFPREQAESRPAVRSPGHIRYLLPVLLTGVVFMIPYMMNGIIAQTGYEMQTVRSQVMALENENQTARMEIAHLESPERIQQIAVKNRGMPVPQKAVHGSGDSEKSVSSRQIRD